MNIVFFPYSALVVFLIIAAFFDFRRRIVPNEISVGGMIIGLTFSFLIPQLHGSVSSVQSLGLSILGILIGGGSLYFIGLFGDFLFKKDVVGGGDIKLLAMIGAFMGWKMAISVLCISIVLVIIYDVIRAKTTPVAYAPFLGLGTFICLFYGL